MKHLFLGISMAFLALVACSSANTRDNKENNTTMNTTGTPTSVYDFTMIGLEGDTIPLSNFKGKVLVIVNTASKCGLTPQYKEIEAFYKEYKEKGVEVLGFPANNFLFQEPGSDEEIKSFCERNYGVTFTMFSKISVKGKDKAPLYQYLTQKELNGVEDASVKWNFQKFLVSKEGKLVRSFDPKTTVEEPEFIQAVEEQLAL